MRMDGIGAQQGGSQLPPKQQLSFQEIPCGREVILTDAQRYPGKDCF